MFDKLIIMSGTGYHECDLAEGALSIKTMFNGGVYYETPDSRYWVDDSQYLILNNRQSYAMQKPRNVLSLCVFYPAQWATEVLRAHTETDEALLENPLLHFPVNFFETLQRHDNLVSPYITRLRQMPFKEAVIDGSPMEEFLLELLRAMLQSQRNIALEAEKLPEARRATRLELLRRLFLTRDYLHASFADNVDIEAMAKIAGLSPYHFIRKFKAAFHETPHSYLRRLRLQKASELLRQTELPITEICYEVGFQSLGSFSNLFQKQNGLSPSAYRIAQF
jgi:AraC family transcriptional regulator